MISALPRTTNAKSYEQAQCSVFFSLFYLFIFFTYPSSPPGDFIGDFGTISLFCGDIPAKEKLPVPKAGFEVLPSPELVTVASDAASVFVTLKLNPLLGDTFVGSVLCVATLVKLGRLPVPNVVVVAVVELPNFGPLPKVGVPPKLGVAAPKVGAALLEVVAGVPKLGVPLPKVGAALPKDGVPVPKDLAPKLKPVMPVVDAPLGGARAVVSTFGVPKENAGVLEAAFCFTTCHRNTFIMFKYDVCFHKYKEIWSLKVNQCML